MQQEHKDSPGANSALRQGVTGLLISLFIWVQVLAVSSLLHECLHRDAAAADHTCAVTLFSHGQIHSAGAPLAVPRPQPQPEPTVACTVTALTAMDYRFRPERAPPVFLPC